MDSLMKKQKRRRVSTAIQEALKKVGFTIRYVERKGGSLCERCSFSFSARENPLKTTGEIKSEVALLQGDSVSSFSSPTDDSTRTSPSGNAINTSDNVFNSMNGVVDYADADGRLTRWWDRFKDRVGRSSTIGSGSGSLATRRTRTPCPPFHQPIPPAPFDYPVVQSCRRPLAVATRFLGPPESPTPSRSTL
ncbi:hypothetical protein G5I_01214 [Acromyrmex echinatior]|uniref:Uncharacterized protein n=1 Tax=Acromyrmex echinatior TaxID=103372 RepID=F4W706_ACREC|nr:hypothetical protein G5I_01214 [Acromyrmex echinatior]